MKLLFQKPFKSIRSLDAIELPDFVVLTGVNGAGKSHLLEALENGSINIEGITPNSPHGQRPIRRFDANSIITQDTGAFSGAQITNEVASHWDQILQLWKNNLESFYVPLRQFPFRDVEKMMPRELLKLDEEMLLAEGFNKEIIPEALAAVKNQIKQLDFAITQQFIQGDFHNRSRLIRKMNLTDERPLLAITQDEFYEAYPGDWQQIDLFQQSFSRMFSSYQRAWRDNELRARGWEKGSKVQPLSQEEFLKKHGPPPWDFLNKIFEISNLDFRINQPSQWEDRPYEPLLEDAKRKLELKFSDLSSGERILMSFALCLYHVKDARASIEYPQVLLFDEIDAPLHPSMTSSLLKTIQQTLVIDRGIKVILTTHSPSTVALSPDASIFVMHKNGPERIVPGSRDGALGILTSGVPTLSVNYENRRQVFVESRYDVEFYGALYQLGKSRLLPEISISFIASGAGGDHGNCDQVIAISTRLREAGNRTIFGLIDWDTENKPSEHVYVLGIDDRYAIDNYILDPLLIGLLMLREKFESNEKFGLPENESYLAIAQGEAGALERIAKQVTSEISKNLKDAEKIDTSEREFKYSDGFSIKLPKWLAMLQGHRLQEVLKITYPRLLRYRGEPDLKNDIIGKVLSDRPGLIPSVVLEIFKEIQARR